MMRRLFAGILLFACSATTRAAPVLRDGDIVFHTSRSSQSSAVQRATGSKYSHMGMVVVRDGEPYVFEAINTVQYTPLDRWVARGAGRHFVAKRLRDADTVLTSARCVGSTQRQSGLPVARTKCSSGGPTSASIVPNSSGRPTIEVSASGSATSKRCGTSTCPILS